MPWQPSWQLQGRTRAGFAQGAAACAHRHSMANQLAALAHARDAARDVGAGIARGRSDLEAVLRAEIQVQTWLTAH